MSGASPRATLIGLTCLFLLPLVVAWLMYIGVIDYHPGETRNHGTLVNPPVTADFPEAFNRRDLAGHWMLLYPLHPDCAEPCRSDIAGLRQVRRALGRDAERLRTVLVSDANADDAWLRELSEIDTRASLVIDASGSLRAQLDAIEGGRGTYMIDPLGNIMMHYRPGTDANELRLDLERLLKYAKTDQQQ